MPFPSVPRHAPRLGIALLALAAATLVPALAAPQASASAPIKNFRLPLFTDEGFRRMMIRSGEALVPSPERVEGKEVEITLFTGKADEGIDAMLAAPVAVLFPEKHLATGADTVRLERIDITVTGADWSYQHGEKTQTLVIKRDARVVFHAALGDILK